MNRSRHRRLRARLSILAIVALLWSQFVLIGHPAASMSVMALTETSAPVAGQHGCEHPQPSDDATVCSAHCSQNDQRSDIERVSAVPALLRVPGIAVASIVTLGSHTGPVDGLPPPVSWHRPTSHPASLLLI